MKGVKKLSLSCNRDVLALLDEEDTLKLIFLPTKHTFYQVGNQDWEGGEISDIHFNTTVNHLLSFSSNKNTSLHTALLLPPSAPSSSPPVHLIHQSLPGERVLSFLGNNCYCLNDGKSGSVSSISIPVGKGAVSSLSSFPPSISLLDWCYKLGCLGMSKVRILSI